MKSINIFFILVFLLFTGGCTIYNGEISAGSTNFSACLTGTKSSSVDQAMLRLTYLSEGSILAEMYNTEFCCATDSVSIKKTGEGNSLMIEIIDEGPFSWCYCPHDLSFTLTGLGRGTYELVLVESEHAYERDTFTVSFLLSEDLDTLIIPDPKVNEQYEWLVLERADAAGCISTEKAAGAELLVGEQVIFYPDGDTLRVRTVLEQTCCGEFAAASQVEGDTLLLYVTTLEEGLCDCICMYAFDYTYGGYTGKDVFYRLYLDEQLLLSGQYVTDGEN